MNQKIKYENFNTFLNSASYCFCPGKEIDYNLVKLAYSWIIIKVYLCIITILLFQISDVNVILDTSYGKCTIKLFITLNE